MFNTRGGRLGEVLRGLRVNQGRGICSDGAHELGPGVQPASTRRGSRARVERRRPNASANEKSHTLESDEAVLRETLRRHDDTRSLKLRVLSRVTKRGRGEKNAHSTPPKPKRAPRRSPTREKRAQDRTSCTSEQLSSRDHSATRQSRRAPPRGNTRECSYVRLLARIERSSVNPRS